MPDDFSFTDNAIKPVRPRIRGGYVQELPLQWWFKCMPLGETAMKLGIGIWQKQGCQNGCEFVVLTKLFCERFDVKSPTTRFRAIDKMVAAGLIFVVQRSQGKSTIVQLNKGGLYETQN